MGLQKELLRNVRNHKYEVTESGLYFPHAKLMFDNYFDISVNGDEPTVFPNLVVDEFRTKALEILFGSDSKLTSFYLAPFEANVSPSANWKASNFDTNATEFTNYKASSRPSWDAGSVDDFAIHNTNDRASFIVDSGSQDTIRGVGLLTSSGKQSTSGVLVAANSAPTAREGLTEDDEVLVGYTVSLNDAS